MSENSKDNKNIYVKWVLIYLISFFIILCTLFDSFIEIRYELKENDISPATIRASKDVEDKIATQLNIEQALKEVNDQFRNISGVEEQTVATVDSLFAILYNIKDEMPNSPDSEKLKAFRDAITISLNDGDVLKCLSFKKESLNKMKSAITSVLKAIYITKTIRENYVEDIQDAVSHAQNLLNYLRLGYDENTISLSIILNVLEPNQVYDKEKTNELKNDVKKSIVPVQIKKDDIIVKKGDKISKNNFEVLNELGKIGTGLNVKVLELSAICAVVITILAAQFFYLKNKAYSVFLKSKNLILINGVMILLIVFAKVFYDYAYLIPFALGPIFILLITNKEKATLVTCILYLPIIAILSSYDTVLIMIIMLSIIITCMVNKRIQQRNDIVYLSVVIAVCGLALTIAFGVLMSMVYDKIFTKAFLSFSSGILSGIITIGFLPIVENVFRIVTPLKLLELSNFNNPLLKRLLMEAPGTYNHSLSVANLAEAGAEAINADHIFVRVASYYHDVGKLSNPMYFKENQMGMENPHDNLSNYESAQIILNHTLAGITISKKYKIPESIKDIMVEHHGTTLVKYFYISEKNHSNSPDEIKEDDFRYKGRIPKTKESAIIMMADIVEATVRSLKVKSKENILSTIDSIIKSRLDEGQFDDSPITLRDLRKIKEAFCNVLVGVYHERVEYPKETRKLVE